QQDATKRAPIAVAGYGEGGLIAFYSAALDPRIRVTFVSGYFQAREELWKEPVYRDVWGLLHDFGDAEIASLIAPRALIVEAARMRRQVGELVDYTQALVRKSPATRAAFWSKADRSSPERWKASTQFYRDYIWDEVIGRLPAPSVPVNARTRLVYDEPKFRG